MSKTLIKVLSTINSTSKITKETVNNKEHYIIKDVVPVVDDVVMNNGLYPKDEIDKSFMSINGNLMPIGHPKVNGQHVSASNAKAINEYYGGAWAENVHKDGDKVLLDAYVDIEFAKNHEKGKQLLERLESMVNGEDTTPIHVSTGLILNKVHKSGKSKGKSYSWVATNMQFDHVAILLNEQGAATPNEGVGMFVNSDGECLIENVSLNESENEFNPTIINKIIQKITALMANNKQEESDPMKDKILQALNAKGVKTDGLTDEQLFTAYNEQAAKDALAKEKKDEDEEEKKKNEKEKAQNSDTPEWAKVLVNRLDTIEQAVNKNQDAEVTAMRGAVKEKFGMSDTAVNALNGEALTELYAQCQTTVSVNGASTSHNNNQSVCDMPE